jgi:dihydroorotase
MACSTFGWATVLSNKSDPPDGVSTDGHRGNRAGPVYDLPTTMAKLVALGFTLSRVIEMATINAARILGRADTLGAISIGQRAEISVLKLQDRDWEAVDSQKKTMQASQALLPLYAIRGSVIYEPIPIQRP